MLNRSRTAVTLVEILIAMAILATLAAVLYPSVAVQLRRGQASAVADQLNYLRESIANYRENVTQYPLLLTQLTVQPVNGDDDSCGANLSNGERNGWRGPYLAQNIVGSFPVGDGTVQNQLVRVPPTTGGGQAGLLQINVTDVDANTATDVEQQFDGNNNFSTGTILWGVAGAGVLTFQIPIRGC